MTLCFLGSYLSWFTPSTMVRSSLVAGAEMMTFLTVPCRWALALVASVKWPVDSMTTSAPVEDQSSLAGSRSANTLSFLPSTVMKSSPAVMVLGRLPRMESYLSRWASVAGLVRSFTATNSIAGFPSAARKTLRPIRPKPLMPTFTAIKFEISLKVGQGFMSWVREQFSCPRAMSAKLECTKERRRKREPAICCHGRICVKSSSCANGCAP